MERQTVERVYLDGTTLVIETVFGRHTLRLREQDIDRLREGLLTSCAMPSSSGVRGAGTPAGEARGSSPALVGHSSDDPVTIILPRHIAAEVQTICEDDDSITGEFAADAIAAAMRTEQKPDLQG